MSGASFVLDPPRFRRRIEGMGSHHSACAETDVWLTPPEIIAALGSFDLDPCAALAQPWPTASHHYTIEENGLVQPWFGRVWLNPPYGKETGRWLGRLKEHGNGIALVFARTETASWFRFIWSGATAIYFLKGRINFYRGSGVQSRTNCGAPVALVAYGAENAAVLRHIGIAGHLVIP